MSQLYNYEITHYVVIFLYVIAVVFLLIHYLLAREILLNTAIFTVLAVAVGIAAYIGSRGPTVLKLVLFILAVQAVNERATLVYFYRALILGFLIVMLSSFIGITDLTYYSRLKVAYSFGFQNPNTVPVVLFAIMSGFNLVREEAFKARYVVLEFLITVIMYHFCQARSALVVCFVTFILLIITSALKDTKFLKVIMWPLQFLFLIMAVFSFYVTISYRSNDSMWVNFNHILSGRLYAWQGYFTRYGISILGNRLSTEYYGALDNAYLQLFFKYGVIAFILYAVIFVSISVFAWKNKRWILLTTIIAFELYFFAEFGPMIANFCPIVLCYGCMFNKGEEIEEEGAYRYLTWRGRKLF